MCQVVALDEAAGADADEADGARGIALENLTLDKGSEHKCCAVNGPFFGGVGEVVSWEREVFEVSEEGTEDGEGIAETRNDNDMMFFAIGAHK